MTGKIRAIFFGTPEFSRIILQALVETAAVTVLAVVTKPDRPVGRKKVLTPSPVKILAKNQGLEVLTPTKLDTTLSSLLSPLHPDLIVVAAYGKIIPPTVLAVPKYGCLNIHPSLLPKYRGPSPVQFAILNGEEKTGVTIILMDDKMDHGPILVQTAVPITPSDTEESLTTKLARVGADLLIQTIPRWVAGEIEPQPQDHIQATYTKLLTREDGRIDWRKPHHEIERQIRAFHPWPGTYTTATKLRSKISNSKYQIPNNDKRIKILKAHLNPGGNLVLDEIQIEGKKPIKVKLPLS